MRATILSGAALAALVLLPTALSAQVGVDTCFFRDATPAEAAERASPLGIVLIPMAGDTATVCYSRPSANDRPVMGELVPFGRPWRTGANEATSIHLPFAATIGGVEVEPGSYSIYTIPGEDEWEIVVNRSWERWGIGIDDAVRAEDVGSSTRPSSEAEERVETFTIAWDAHGEGMGHLVMEWEETRVEIPVHRAGMGHH